MSKEASSKTPAGQASPLLSALPVGAADGAAMLVSSVAPVEGIEPVEVSAAAVPPVPVLLAELMELGVVGSTAEGSKQPWTAAAEQSVNVTTRRRMAFALRVRSPPLLILEPRKKFAMHRT